MTILLIGSSTSQFLCEFQKQITLRFPQVQCDILDFFLGIYWVNGKQIHFGVPASRTSRIVQTFVIIKNYFKVKKCIRKQKAIYDICNIHYLDPRYFLFLKMISRSSLRIVVSVYGSDFYLYRRFHFFMTPFYNRAAAITFANEKLALNFNLFFENKYSDRIKICRIGLRLLDTLKNIKIKNPDLATLKTHLGIPIDKIVIVIGVNSDPNCQHLKIISEIKKINTSWFEKLILVVPMTYGKYYDNIQNVKKFLKNYPIHSIVLEHFLPDEEIAILRLLTDIMVHLPRFDQLSGAMQETLFAGNIVITGSWLPYQVFKDHGIQFLEIDALKRIPDILTTLLSDITRFKKLCSSNEQAIFHMSSWDSVILKWREIYRI